MTSHSPEQATVAAELERHLVAYAEGLRELLQAHWEPELYRALSDRFDRMQMLATALPGLGPAWTELLITRVELTHALWSTLVPARVDGKVVAFHARHRMLIEDVRRRCREYAAADTKTDAVVSQF